jgi:hypothetical protein
MFVSPQTSFIDKKLFWLKPLKNRISRNRPAKAGRN